MINYDVVSFLFACLAQHICQQSPKLTLSGSNMGLVLTASARLITKLIQMS